MITNKIEYQIVSAAVKQLLDNGFTITVFDGEEHVLKKSDNEVKILDYMYSSDEDVLLVYRDNKFFGSVSLVYGNDADVISDYSCCLENFLTDADRLANQL